MNNIKIALEAGKSYGNGCHFMDWSKVQEVINDLASDKRFKLQVLAGTTNGTSGIVQYRGRAYYYFFEGKTCKVEVT